jgi:hypothetical protein
MASPTESAKAQFDYAANAAKTATQYLNKQQASAGDSQLGSYNQAVALAHLAMGLSNLATGLRATYMLLEDVKGQLDPATGMPFSANRRS